MTLGIDVSSYQGPIDWARVRNESPVRFAMVRLAEWRAGKIGLDSLAQDNIDGAREAGIVVGTYVRVDPVNNTPEHEAMQWAGYRSLLDVDRPGFLVPAFDIEDKSDRSSWLREFIDAHRRISPHLHDRVIIYTSGSFPATYYPTGWDRTDQRVALWVANWSAAPGATGYTFAGRTAIHQYSNTGTVPGITGAVDLDCTMAGWSLLDLAVDLR